MNVRALGIPLGQLFCIRILFSSVHEHLLSNELRKSCSFQFADCPRDVHSQCIENCILFLIKHVWQVLLTGSFIWYLLLIIIYIIRLIFCLLPCHGLVPAWSRVSSLNWCDWQMNGDDLLIIPAHTFLFFMYRLSFFFISFFVKQTNYKHLCLFVDRRGVSTPGREIFRWAGNCFRRCGMDWLPLIISLR